MNKQCFKCKKILPLDMFYKHPQMADGRVNKCKECNKADVTKNRALKIDYYRSYDRNRGSRLTHDDILRYRAENPKKYKAHSIVNYAKKIGLIKKLNCEICGSTYSVGHHDDYDKPLEVRWLCSIHHFEWHKTNIAKGDYHEYPQQ